jgi:hypothetical protein
LLYVISDGELVKIGVSKHPEKRLNQLQTGHPKKLKLLAQYDMPDIYEKRFHKQLWIFRARHNGEWFKIDVEQLLDFISNTEKTVS